jgi:hypothetical protein
MTMKMRGQTALLLNGAVILIVGASATAIFRTTFFAEAVAPCKERFTGATRLSLERNGGPASAAELQSQLANSDWGLASAAKVVKTSAGAAKYALELDLAKVPSATPAAADERAGVGFNWMPHTFKGREAACLTYSVKPDEGFSFGAGGRLPGLRGTASGTGAADEGFSVRYTWTPTGELEIFQQLPLMPTGRHFGGKIGTFSLTAGRWTELEQEIVLNTPGKPDGVLRAWQDGRLVMEKTDVVFRTNASGALAGVLAETVGGTQSGDPKRGSQKIAITPFELRWP